MPETVTVFLRDASGGRRHLSLPVGENLMLALRAHGIPITSICGGRAICGMCRVSVLPNADLPVATRNERRLLDVLPGTTSDRRLACQIVLSAGSAGLSFMLDEPARHQ